MRLYRSLASFATLLCVSLLLGACATSGAGGSRPPEYFANMPEREIFTSAYDNFVKAGGGGKSPVFTLDKVSLVTRIGTLHFNDGKGAAPGRISLKDAGGKTFGPWQAKGVTYGETANAFWQCEPGVVLEPGTYIIVDSDPSTWSSSGKGSGLAQVYGKQ